MTIDIFKGVDANGNAVAFFGNDPREVVVELFSMADDAADAELTTDLSKVDTEKPVQRVAMVVVDTVEDKSTYDLKIDDVELADDDKPDDSVGKPDAGRKPSEAPGSDVIQSLVFDTSKFTAEQARAWIKSHDGFGDYGVKEAEGSIRFRQYDPAHFDKLSTSQLSEGVKAVFGVVSGASTEKPGDEEASKKAAECARVKVAIRDMNKAINARGLRLLKDSTTITKAEDGTEERFILSLVLEPNDGTNGAPLNPDTQDDIYSADEIRATAHGWMENFGHIDLQHSWQALGKAEVMILESYLAPVDFDFGDHKVLKGTWMLGLRVMNDELWTAIKTGEIGAYSVGGSARRVPIEDGPAKE